MLNMGFHEWAGHGSHATEGDCPGGTREPWEGFEQGGRLPTGSGGGETGPWEPRRMLEHPGTQGEGEDTRPGCGSEDPG